MIPLKRLGDAPFGSIVGFTKGTAYLCVDKKYWVQSNASPDDDVAMLINLTKARYGEAEWDDPAGDGWYILEEAELKEIFK